MWKGEESGQWLCVPHEGDKRTCKTAGLRQRSLGVGGLKWGPRIRIRNKLPGGLTVCRVTPWEPPLPVTQQTPCGSNRRSRNDLSYMTKRQHKEKLGPRRSGPCHPVYCSLRRVCRGTRTVVSTWFSPRGTYHRVTVQSKTWTRHTHSEFRLVLLNVSIFFFTFKTVLWNILANFSSLQ